ncbi:MAG: hemerythrin domain-containing protein [Bacteroides sp.]|nr:hemerythrin domain-containing protein [Bacteroides sp.]MCM1413106.1 hemerythrin domain-containing protein [Bacteroides sp.]MCM1472152.1 hemerythrin domain-containing protein [Bacteroides sp.]
MAASSKHRISADMSMAGLVESNFNILPILSRFGIPLGFGTKTIREICQEQNIDLDTFLLIVNFTLTGLIMPHDTSVEQARAIVAFLHNSHDYFMVYKFPHIRSNLVEALDAGHSDINPAIIHFFDEYVAHVVKHFDYEEKTVWPYVNQLGRNKGTKSDYNIEMFVAHHDEIGEKLSDLKNIILRYYTTSLPNRMYDVLVDIYNCESDLNSHNDIENNILIPMVAQLEEQYKS